MNHLKRCQKNIRYFDCADMESITESTLRGEDIHIWFADTDDRRLLAQKEVLSDKEQEKVLRYKNESTKRCYQIGHTVLRLLLARYLGVPAEALVFTYGTHGKPSLLNSNCVHFNISHSGNRIALAFTAHTPIGVDIEYAREPRKTDLIVRRFFHPQEAAHYRSLPEAERQLFFYERWTAREAALKALGIGLTVETNAFLIQQCADSGTFFVKDGPPGSELLVLSAVNCPDGYAGCVAYRT